MGPDPFGTGPSVHGMMVPLLYQFCFGCYVYLGSRSLRLPRCPHFSWLFLLCVSRHSPLVVCYGYATRTLRFWTFIPPTRFHQHFYFTLRFAVHARARLLRWRSRCSTTHRDASPHVRADRSFTYTDFRYILRALVCTPYTTPQFISGRRRGSSNTTTLLLSSLPLSRSRAS